MHVVEDEVSARILRVRVEYSSPVSIPICGTGIGISASLQKRLKHLSMFYCVTLHTCIVFYSPRETRYTALGLLRELAAVDHVTDVDNKELMLLTAEYNGDSARERERENRLRLFTRPAGPMTGALVTGVTHCAPSRERP